MVSNEISIKIYNDLDQDLKNVWLGFEKKNGLHFFQKFYFIKNFISGKKGKFIFIVLSSQEKVFCILPLHINKIFGLKILQWIGTKEFDYCGPILNNFENFVSNKKSFNKLWKKILTNLDIDFIFFDRQIRKIYDFNNPFVFFLKNNFVSKVFFIDLTTNYDTYLNKIKNKKFLNEFQRTKTKLIEQSNIEFYNLDINNEELKIEEILEQKKNFLERKNINHIINQDMYKLFSRFKIEDPNSIKIGILKVNKEIIAANIGLIFNKRFYYYMPVMFNEKFNKFSPGKILLSYLIEWSIINKLEIFDFGLGDENYKKYWSNNSENLSRYFYFKSLKGFAAYCFIRFYTFFKK